MLRLKLQPMVALVDPEGLVDPEEALEQVLRGLRVLLQ